MKKLPLLASTLIAAVAISVPAFADISQNKPSITLDDGSSLGYGFSVSGSGTAVIQSTASKETPATMPSISGSGTIFVQLNGGGYLNVTGTVTLEEGGYISYQGSTTFTGTATLGSIEFYQDDATICDVVFSGSSAVATVGKITVDETEGTGTATLTVENDATLKVTDGLTINDDFGITIDAGTMELGGSATGSKSASITIENGGQLSVTGDNVSLNSATIEIILSEDNISGGDGVYALIGSGSLSNVTIKITVDEALAELLASGGEYTFDIYDSSTLTLGSNVDFNYDALSQYGYNLNGDGTLTIRPLPEPSMFGFFFGLGAIGLVATRRRRRAA